MSSEVQKKECDETTGCCCNSADAAVHQEEKQDDSCDIFSYRRPSQEEAKMTKRKTCC